MIKITVIVPLFNKESTILKALISIKNQDFKDYEVVVVNDGSTDQSEEIVTKWISSLDTLISSKFRFFTQQNSGVSSARNKGVLMSNFNYIAFLDADDYWEKNHLKNIVYLIGEFNHKVDLFSSGVKYIQNRSFLFPRIPKKYNKVQIVDYFKVALISNGFINSSSVCCKRSSLLLFPFPESMSNFEDGITWARICGGKGFAFSPPRTSIYVLNYNSCSASVDFKNYIRYRDILYKIKDVSKIKLGSFLFLFTAIHLFHVKTTNNFTYFLNNALSIFFKSPLIAIAILIAFLIPAQILLLIKKIRLN